MDLATEPVELICRDGQVLGGQCWRPEGSEAGTVIVNNATGVLARYYARYAAFLARQGYCVLTYDYRGIGASRPSDLRHARMRWRDWGDYDFDAAVRWARQRDPLGLLVTVGHSIGGFLPGFAPAAVQVDRFLTVGAQYAYWRDYAADRRLRLACKWHLAMPALTALYGFFPGRRLGWLEDLPAGVAYEWAFRRARMELSYPRAERAETLARFAAVRAPILALSMSDDEFGTPAAIRRGLDYYRRSDRQRVQLRPRDLGLEKVGHFDPFHDRHCTGLWQASLQWIAEGRHPWTVDEHLPAEG
ncbi:alpha/beta fold hydrolase [Pseudomonas sp. RIT-PI-AD]|uniref:alpha/beta hydrolase family protein n=1 Tax=Pseudomonas sp. RIT-PI-AD TaxID=3035294 RepID=UPI00320A1731